MSMIESLDDLETLAFDTSMPPHSRAELLIFHIVQHGLDVKQTIATILAECDFGRAMRKKQESIGTGTLATERFIGRTQQGNRTYASVTRGNGEMHLPATEEQLEGLRTGDAVLIDVKNECIVGRDGVLPIRGDVMTVDTQPAELPGHVIAKEHGEQRLLRLSQDLIDEPELCQPGRQVVVDNPRGFAIQSINVKSAGEELLADLSTLPRVTRDDIGSPKPVVDEILNHVRLSIDHPEWFQRMHARPRRSYLFSGPTGGGKSYHVKLLQTELHDLVEQRTGQRTSCLVMIDASKFWRSYFGETEGTITAFVEKLSSLGRRVLRDCHGRELRVPLCVVLEEAEALLRSRSERGDGSSHLFDRPLAHLLAKVESAENSLDVPLIWICTSNRPDLADSAALRRMGMRQVVFSSLTAQQARAVLSKKIPADMPIHCTEPGDGNPREAFINKVQAYLYGPEPKQGIVEVQLGSSERRVLNRSDSVMPAVLEEAINYAIDRSLQRSETRNELLGLHVNDVIHSLHQHFVNVSRTIRPHNLAEYAAEWFAQETLHVANVTSLMTPQRRPLLSLVS